jgi:hypothetical protein
MKYKSQNDIPYLKFMKFSEEISENPDDAIFVADKVMEHFYPEVTENEAVCVAEFSIALNTIKKKPLFYLLSLRKLKKADSFIDADTFKNDRDFESVLKMIVRPLWWFGKVDVYKISLQDGNKIMGFFLKNYKG